MASTKSFYDNLKPFSRFDEITEERHYRSVPSDWMVVLTDIKGSTEAIDSGRYRDVNTIGVAGIVTVKNALDGLEFPCVFGGDGATMLLPESCREAITDGLVALIDLARDQFQLELRVGIVPVRDIEKAGHRVAVARFAVESGMPVPMLRGGGVSVAEMWIKEKPESYAIRAQGGAGAVNLKGLSCRWKAIPGKNGRVLSMIVSTTGARNHDETYRLFLTKLRQICGGDLDKMNPVHSELMDLRPTEQVVSNEKRFHRGRRTLAWLARRAEIHFGVFLFKSRFKALETYKKSMRTHSDYRKFDDMLRMVIDCTPEQTKAIQELLESFRKEGRLFYGIFESDACLMTCFVPSLKNQAHIHYIDGDGGGYTLAAKEMKAQMRAGQKES